MVYVRSVPSLEGASGLCQECAFSRGSEWFMSGVCLL